MNADRSDRRSGLDGGGEVIERAAYGIQHIANLTVQRRRAMGLGGVGGIEQFYGVNGARGDLRAHQASADVHHAARVSGGDERCAGACDLGELGFQHILGESRFDEAVKASATATLIGVGERRDVERWYGAEYGDWLAREMLSVYEVARGVIDDAFV